ncbi:VanW family protein [Hydrogenoanaerobacterium sp.]|uniref:VanW family protein n=1 Tax=Hydrogenoanaerobacterium sp. TaxID=2953763 RepID=UPI0028969C0B|nr:VanW family protein [Hydrogenoanaerobacterium sp.]
MKQNRARRKLFCEYNPFFYQLALYKTIFLRHLKNCFGGEHFALAKTDNPLPYTVKTHRSLLLRRLEGVDMALQQNKVTNLRLASAHINRIAICPGETFSFWRIVGNPTVKKGYLEGLTIAGGAPSSAAGGGLCQLANMVHWLVLHSPLTVTELHHHTDALFPDCGRRVPFGTGTSVFYNAVDYRFKNETENTYGLLIWLDETDLCGELRCGAELSSRYRIEERDHHYSCEPHGYYRNSEIWKKQIDCATGELQKEWLIFKNHSKVMYDDALIPREEIRV